MIDDVGRVLDDGVQKIRGAQVHQVDVERCSNVPATNEGQHD
jgi:hypothetical protein